MKKSKGKTRIILILGAAVFAVSTVIALLNPFQVVQWKITDLFFRGRAVNDAITVIAIDGKSLNAEATLGRYKDWPRSYFSQLLRTLDAKKPAIVAFDLDFRETSRGMSDLRIQQLLRDYERRLSASSAGSYNWYSLLKRFEPQTGTHPDDVDFQKAIDESGKVALTLKLTSKEDVNEYGGKYPAIAGAIAPIFQGSNVVLGFTNMIADRDSVVRRFVPAVDKYQSFAVAIANAYLGKDAVFPNNSALPINFAGGPLKYRTISFVDAVTGNFQDSDINGKIVLIGATDPTLQDLAPTPTSSLFMPGVKVHANIIQQILEGKYLTEQSTISVILVILIFALAGSFLFLNSKITYLGIIFGIVAIGWPFIAFGMYQKGIILNAVYPEISWILTAISALWYRNQTEFREKREIQRAFAHYVSPVVVNELAKHPETLRLGGKRERISVMFSDIAGFTTLAEQLSPEDIVALLNDYLTAMTEVIFSHHGTLDKYQGDAIMALFGAPLLDEHHEVNVCHAALEMRKALITLHEKWNAIPRLPYKDELIKLDFRIGIATGPAVLGNVGSEKRFDYTAIGDIVNLGSRLEGINKKYGTRVIVDKETFAAVTENHNPFIFRKLDIVRVKGKKIETEIFELVGRREGMTDDTKSMLDDFENGRILYTQRNFKDARQYFESALTKIPTDPPSLIYLNRCDFYIRKPPNRTWNAVVDLEEK